jgi:hypothetical protein
VRGILFLSFDFVFATVGFSLNNGSKGLILPLGLYIGCAVGEVRATVFWSMAGAWGWPVDVAWISDMSDLGASDGLGFFASADLAADGPAFLASTVLSGACLPEAGGSGLGAG